MFHSLTRRVASRCNVATRMALPVRHVSTAPQRTAYEEALVLIETDKKERLKMLEKVEKEIARVQKSNSPAQSAQLAALNALKFDLQVKSELNDPEVHRTFARGEVDMGRPVFRYMRQKEFEKAPLKQLMERITQMNVVPDVLPLDVKPTVQVNIHFADGSAIEPGVFTKPEQSIKPPKVDVTNFHTEQRLYTLALVDPDSPDVENKTYQQRCHWLITNVPLSTTQSIVESGETVLEYVPPHPQKGTKYHRYTLIAYEQPNGGKDKVDVKVDKRDGFDIKNLAQSHGLQVRGVSFFRQVWDETVSDIYSDILKMPEPVYGKPPKPQRYIRRATYF
ncbi:phosphatidylethanolamine-binding protein [Dichotomocladium elegans]|nr:phosphatidylethanolamine-binding protein [Dichotomocladium elegans]